MRYIIEGAVLGSPLGTLMAAAGQLVGGGAGGADNWGAGHLHEQSGRVERHQRHALSLDMSFHNGHTPGI